MQKFFRKKNLQNFAKFCPKIFVKFCPIFVQFLSKFLSKKNLAKKFLRKNHVPPPPPGGPYRDCKNTWIFFCIFVHKFCAQKSKKSTSYVWKSDKNRVCKIDAILCAHFVHTFHNFPKNGKFRPPIFLEKTKISYGIPRNAGGCKMRVHNLCKMCTHALCAKYVHFLSEKTTKKVRRSKVFSTLCSPRISVNFPCAFYAHFCRILHILHKLCTRKISGKMSVFLVGIPKNTGCKIFPKMHIFANFAKRENLRAKMLCIKNARFSHVWLVLLVCSKNFAWGNFSGKKKCTFCTFCLREFFPQNFPEFWGKSSL